MKMDDWGGIPIWGNLYLTTRVYPSNLSVLDFLVPPYCAWDESPSTATRPHVPRSSYWQCRGYGPPWSTICSESLSLRWVNLHPLDDHPRKTRSTPPRRCDTADGGKAAARVLEDRPFISVPGHILGDATQVGQNHNSCRCMCICTRICVYICI